ncbi:hypothetical protein P4H39_02440 [Paenibacillus lautus]|uniref:hypothetical protein n=1 Tax=Paenibacillus lautus TaxID=1401 RepID=UPI002DBF062A|nr:hypothetical protein [Paenibacillus lautus]MEC0201484.1 hypothetical protein [Paenibacillus lautus]
MNKKLLLSVVAIPLLAGGVIYYSSLESNSSEEATLAQSTKVRVNDVSINSDNLDSTTTSNPKTIRGELEVYPFEEGVNKADLIVKVKIVGKIGEVSDPVPKTVFNTQILSAQKDDPTLDSESISIMQQGNSEVLFNGNELFKENEEYILFLKKAVGPVAEEYPNLYWILGEESNMYKSISNNLVEKQGHIDEELKDVESNQISTLEENTSTQILIEEEFIEKIKSITNNY